MNLGQPGLPSDWQTFISNKIDGLSRSLSQQLQQSQNVFVDKLSNQLGYMESKFQTVADKPRFRRLANQKNFDRTQTYKLYLLDIKNFIENNNAEDALACATICLEAISKYQEQIKIADASYYGWETVDRLGESTSGKEIRSVEAKIQEERRLKRRYGQNPTNQAEPNNQPSQAHPRQAQPAYQASNRSFGPCAWCSGAGHGYKSCRLFKEDVEAGRAIYDSQQRKWIRVANSSSQSRRD